jgi:hypothetical protein
MASTEMSIESATAVATEPVKVFISYARADRDIAAALFEELQENIAPGRVTCFLDTESIPAGYKFEPILNKALHDADWLVCIYTGEQSEFCGYEIGVFSQVNELAARGNDSRLVCLHDVESIPAVFQSYQNKLVTFPPEATEGQEEVDESKFYATSDLAQFFAAFYKYKGLYTGTDAARHQKKLIQQVKRVSEAFKAARNTDIRFDTPTQLSIQISVHGGNRDGRLARIPAEAEVSGTFQSLGLFGLMPPMSERQLPKSTWGKVREASQTPFRRLQPAMQFLERDMLDAANGRTLSGMEATFVSNDRVYRPILARDVVLENGDHKFQVLFVETLPRQLLGKKHTSLILAGLLLASRFRFAYLEEPDAVAAKFADAVPEADFEANCWQLYYHLDRAQHEAIELGLLNPVEFVRAFGEDRRGMAERLLKTSAEAREALNAALPEPGERIGAGNRKKVRDAVLTYLKTIGPVNGQFLAEGLEVFRSEVLAQLENDKA